MKDNLTVLEADLDYAERMVRTGFGTAEQAAQTCGVSVDDLRKRLARDPQQAWNAPRKQA
ncbi:MAG TPA: hypothetical protein VM164_12710 [Burkholderiales bacterium]|nr:hypothetical protein [Burkholderiales bacterium]